MAGIFPALHQGYDQFGLSAFTWHDHWLVPPVPLKAFGSPPGIIEGPAFMGWHPMRHVTHKVAKDITFDGDKAVQQGHDVGYLILHIQAPMNVMTGLHILFSKHKVMFPNTTVLLNGKPLGTYLIILLGLICANPVSLPTGVLILIRCTVWTTLSPWDILRGLFYIAVDVIVDMLWNLVMKGDAVGKIKALVPNSFYKNFLGKIFDSKVFQAAAEAGVKKVGDLVAREGLGKVAKEILKQTASKLVDHLVKTWGVSPIIGPLTQGKPSDVGVGRGDGSWKPFK